MNEVYIYLLKDPLTGEIRYVGKTATETNIRFNGHISEARVSQKNERCKWIYRLLGMNTKPIMEVIEKCNESNWEEREQFLIEHYKSLGHSLTNIARGGRDARPSGFEPMVRINSVPLSNDESKALKALNGLSLSEHIRRAIDEYLARLRKERKD